LTADRAAPVVSTTLTRRARLAPAFVDVRRVYPDGEFDLVFELSTPSALLPEDLSVPLVGGEDAGAGPYRVTVRTPSQIVLERFERYYRGTPAIRRVVLQPFDAMRAGWVSLLRSEVDMVSDIPADTVEFVQSEDIQVVQYERWYQFLIAFNVRRPALRSPAVRRALNMAIDRPTLLKTILRGLGSPSHGPLWPKYWAYDQSAPTYAHDTPGSSALLDRAGYTHATATHADAPPARLRFVCLVPESFSVQERIALAVQRALLAVGVDMQVDLVPFSEFNTRVEEQDFDAVLLDLISGPTPGRPFIFWRSSRTAKGLNVFGYENAEAESLFSVIRTTTNEAAVRSATKRLQRVFHDDPPALFIAWNERARAFGPTVVIPDEERRDPMSNFWRWTLRTERTVRP
jgi:ABC-type transport system substrate-binding protein